jgi:hypothetical protein
MYSLHDDRALPLPGFPIRKSPDQSPFNGSPKLIAVYHVLHRLSLPRHPPYALSSLTIKNRNQIYQLHTIFNKNAALMRFYYLNYPHMQLSKNIFRKGFQGNLYKTFGGGERDRTDDPLRARQVLSQLSYTPKFKMVGLAGLEPATSRLSVVCSSQLSYKPSRHRYHVPNYKEQKTRRTWSLKTE